MDLHITKSLTRCRSAGSPSSHQPARPLPEPDPGDVAFVGGAGGLLVCGGPLAAFLGQVLAEAVRLGGQPGPDGLGGMNPSAQ